MTKNSVLSFLLILIFSSSLFSCATAKKSNTTFHKRKYTKGYYLNSSKNYSNTLNKQIKSIDYNNLLASVDNSIKHKNEEILLEDNLYEISKEINNLIDKKQFDKKIKKLAQFINTDKQDSVEIITTNGRVYRGIVVKSDYEGYFIKLSPEREIYISNNEIKKLTVLSSNNLNLNKDSTIIAAPPEDYYAVETDEVLQYPDEELVFQEKKIESMSLLSFICGILGFFGLGALGWVAAILLGKTGISNIEKEPNKYKGRGLAVAGRVLGIIGLTLTAIAFLLIIVLLATLI